MLIMRLLLTRRWVALSVVAVMMAIACLGLGRWQFSRSYRTVDGYTQESAAVPLDALDSAAHPLSAAVANRQVTVSGTFDASHQRLLRGHVVGGGSVFWVVTPLRRPDGTAVEVVRGWVAVPDAAITLAPSAAVQLTGRIRPLDPTVSSASVIANGAVDAALVRQLPYPIVAGYILRTAQLPPDPLSLQPVPSSPPAGRVGLRQWHLLNAFYSVQWWFFAAIIGLFWLRLFAAELVHGRASSEGELTISRDLSSLGEGRRPASEPQPG